MKNTKDNNISMNEKNISDITYAKIRTRRGRRFTALKNKVYKENFGCTSVPK